MYFFTFVPQHLSVLPSSKIILSIVFLFACTQTIWPRIGFILTELFIFFRNKLLQAPVVIMILRACNFLSLFNFKYSNLLSRTSVCEILEFSWVFKLQ